MKKPVFRGIIVALSFAAVYFPLAGSSSEGMAFVRSAMELSDDPFRDKLVAMAGNNAEDCGVGGYGKASLTIESCVVTALTENRAFFARYVLSTARGELGYGLVSVGKGQTEIVEYNSMTHPPARTSRRMRLENDNRFRITPCVNPVALVSNSGGMITCSVPINKDESLRASKRPVVDAAICEVAKYPFRFNNRLVRIHGRVSGNFEYSMISGAGCDQALWFDVADSFTPGLVAYVPGRQLGGEEDSDGKWIEPVQVKLKKDYRYRQFVSLMQLRAKKDEELWKRNSSDYRSHQVTAVFVGRIDSVNEEVTKLQQRSIYGEPGLGFGHMGLFSGRFVMYSVETAPKLTLGR